VVVIGVGLESGCNKILRYLKKGTVTVDDNMRAIELSKKYKIPLMGSFMIGNPQERIEDLEKTLKFIRNYRSNPYLAPLSYITTPFPGTELWEYAKKRGIALDDYDSYCMDIPNKIEDLKKAPILTDIDIESFFSAIQEFKHENELQLVKGIALTLSLSAIVDEIKLIYPQRDITSLKMILSHPLLFLKLLLSR